MKKLSHEEGFCNHALMEKFPSIVHIVQSSQIHRQHSQHKAELEALQRLQKTQTLHF